MTEISQNESTRPNGSKNTPNVVEMGAFRDQAKLSDNKVKSGEGGGGSNIDKAIDFIQSLFVRCEAESKITLMAHEPTSGFRVISSFPLYSNFLIDAFMTQQPMDSFEFFFQFSTRRPDGTFEPTRFGGFDTGTVHPTAYAPLPDAYWETSEGNFQAVWDWGKAIPVEASAARLEALIHEFGGVLGTHQLDNYLRIPWSINHKTNYDKPVVDMLSDKITPRGKAWFAENHE